MGVVYCLVKICRVFRVLNISRVQLAQNLAMNSNSKHIDVRHHSRRELVRQRDIAVMHVPSEIQHAATFDSGLSIRCVCVSAKISDELEMVIVQIRFHNRFIYVGVDSSVYALLTGRRS